MASCVPVGKAGQFGPVRFPRTTPWCALTVVRGELQEHYYACEPPEPARHAASLAAARPWARAAAETGPPGPEFIGWATLAPKWRWRP
ncbi:hypothetical protein ACU4GD_19115 [Cupriavidus basilensis]